MKTFEIHITSFGKQFHNLLRPLGIKTITIQDLRFNIRPMPYKSDMTAHTIKCPTYHRAKKEADRIANLIRNDKLEVQRIKIESPFYPEYIDLSLHLEVHGEIKDIGDIYKFAPVSQNLNSGKYLFTDREYKINRYEEFRNTYKNLEVEMCLYDSNPWYDIDWLKDYKEWYDNRLGT